MPNQSLKYYFTKLYNYFWGFTKITHQGKVLVITNPKVAGLHLKTLLTNLETKEIYCHTIPDGENYKNFETINGILETAFNHRLDRHSLMIAFGGGVIGDMVGFASGIFMRGINFIQIPTTLLAQVDSSVGGKTGINNHFGKNLIGLFHQPKAVYIDPRFLKTLPKREFNAGIAEVIKMAICFDKNFFNLLQDVDITDRNTLLEIIHQAVNIKAKIVAQDERENGIRAALNYGHTFGHIIELQSGYGHYLHGEAVSLGMIMANKLALKLKLITQKEFDAVLNLLQHYQLPTDYTIQNKESFYQSFFLDKKIFNDKIKFILPDGIGNVCFKDDIPKEVILEVLDEFSK